MKIFTLTLALILSALSAVHASEWEHGVCIEDGSEMWTKGDKLIVGGCGNFTVYRIAGDGWNELTNDFSGPRRVEIGKFSSLDEAKRSCE